MNNFVIPQFIDTEDKILGSITVRQFLTCTIGGLIIFIAFKLSDFWMFIFEAIILFLITVLFAFIKINGKLFHNFLIDVIVYLFKTPRFAVWQKKESVVKIQEQPIKKDDYVFKPKSFPKTKLSEISLIIDTGGAYVGEEDNSTTQQPLQNLQ